MITYLKVLVTVLAVTCSVPCLGDRLNDRHLVYPTEDDSHFVGRRGGPNNNFAINFGGVGGSTNRANGGQPPRSQLPPNAPPESERVVPVHFPGQRPTPSPKPVTSASHVALPPRPTTKPACAKDLECDAPCERDEEYNSTIRARMDELIKEQGGLNAILNDRELKTLLEENVVPEENTLSLRGGLIETPVCAGQEEIFFPQRGKTENDEWAFVLNQGSTKQGVKYEKCISEGNACNLGAAGTEVSTVCRQKYIYKKMLVMNASGNKLSPEQVLMPSCCVCYVVKPYSIHDFGRVASRNDGCY